jgi:hypothetical protein
MSSKGTEMAIHKYIAYLCGLERSISTFFCFKGNCIQYKQTDADDFHEDLTKQREGGGGF